MDIDDIWHSIIQGIVKATTFVFVRRNLEKQEKTTRFPVKNKGGLTKD